MCFQKAPKIIMQWDKIRGTSGRVPPKGLERFRSNLGCRPEGSVIMLPVKAKLHADTGVNHPLRTSALSTTKVFLMFWDVISVVPNMMHVGMDLTTCMQFSNNLHSMWRSLRRVSLLVCSLCLLPHYELCISHWNGLRSHDEHTKLSWRKVQAFKNFCGGIYIQTHKQTNRRQCDIINLLLFF